jgi:hypothetical protein
MRYGRSRLTRVDGYAHELRTGSGELLDLQGGAFDIDGVGVGHRLNDYRVLASDLYPVYVYRY